MLHDDVQSVLGEKSKYMYRDIYGRALGIE